MPEPTRNPYYESSPRQFTFWQRVFIFLAAHIGYWLIYLIGRSMRWRVVGWENFEQIYKAGKRPIYTFWHGRIFPATWFWRKRGIVVMTSQNFDGEYIARFIRMHGYGAARGSSSRGGLRALAEMARWLQSGYGVAFTIDGPHGPRYVAKIGPVLLARKTGHPIFCFHISMKRKIQLNSWDHFQIPLPFTEAVVLMAPPIYVPADADEEVIRQKHAQMQAVLDELRERGDSWWAKRKHADLRGSEARTLQAKSKI